MSLTDAIGGPTETRRQRRRGLFRPSEETQLLERLNKMFDACRQSRISYERKWYENMAFYFGKQYVQWTTPIASTNTNIMRLFEPPMPPWRVRMVVNKIKPVVRKELAKITKEKPQPFVIPASTDDDDLVAARAGEAIYEHVTRELDFNKVIRRAVFWKLLCGTAFIKDWYDPDKYDKGGVQGAIQMEAVNAFQLLAPDVQEEEIENQAYLIHVLAKPVEWVKEKYKKDVQPDTGRSSGLLEQRFMSAMGVPEPTESMVAVKEIWIKPCADFPDGAVITWANDVILSKEDKWPWGYAEFPFTKLDHIPTGQFYADSVICDLVPVQKELNRTRSQVIEAKNRMSKPQLAAPRGSIDPSKITSEPGLIVFYTPGYQPPQPIPLVPIPGYVIDELVRCQQDIDDISGQHEISRGSAPTGVSAATAISFLQEQDDSMLSPTVTSLEEGTAKIGRHILAHVSTFWEAERTIQILGENNAYESYVFTKAALRGNTDLNVQAGSATPRSSAAKQAFIMEMMEKQYITVEQGLRYLQMGETTRMYEELQVSARQAQRENLRMTHGEQVSVNTWDEHDIHMQEHNVFRRRQAFERLPEEVKVLFEQHVQIHTQMIGQAQGTPIMPGQPLPPPVDPSAPSPEGEIGGGIPTEDMPGGPPTGGMMME